MSTHKYIDRICILGLVFALVLSALFVNGQALGIQSAERVMGYEHRLFDTGKVHTIDIIMEDWDSFIDTCRNEEYSVCSLVIDGEAFKNVAIRGKGNTSLSSVASMNSDRYSFKVEFDHYDSTKSYHGLDKLSLNNIIQDTTFMKDYLTYQLMGSFGAAAPLCSYVYITVNGEEWGLYLAVEAVEDSFLQRNYGSNYGELYKPDSMNFGGGRGNGKDFNMEDFMAGRDNAGNSGSQTGDADAKTGTSDTQAGAQLIRPSGAGGFAPGAQAGRQPWGQSQAGSSSGDSSGTNMPSGQWGGRGETDPNRQPGSSGQSVGKPGGSGGQMPDMGDWNGQIPDMGGGGGFMGGFMGKGGSDVLLQYTDDDPASYSNIFSSAKTDITEADQTRLIRALKTLSEGNPEDAVNVEQVIRYFVVHNFVVNGDSYTGSMIHNYYLYENGGRLEMLPWDYNLAYGTFQGSNANSAVNDPIDTPLSVTGSGRPIIDWIFASEEYTELYHRYFAEFLEQTDFAAIIDRTGALIADYVKKDPSKFCTYEDFEAGVAVLREFCLLREQSVQGQLDGSIPATSAGQRSDSSALVDASHLTLSHMGSMGMGGRNGNMPGGNRPEDSQNGGGFSQNWQENTIPGGENFPNFGDFSGMFPSGDTSGLFPSGDMSAMFPEDGSRFPGMTAPEGQDGAVPSVGLRPEGGFSRPTGGGRTEALSGTVPGSGMTSSSTQSPAAVVASILLLPAAMLIAKTYRRKGAGG